MGMAATVEPRIIHETPGRLRVHLAGWQGSGLRRLETQLRALPGVRGAEANPLTGNVLIRFNQQETHPAALLAEFPAVSTEASTEPPPPRPEVRIEHGKGVERARIAVPGLDCDPRLAREVVEHLERHPGVSARANPLTGRVLVEFNKGAVQLQDLLSEIIDLGLPDLPRIKRPTDPMALEPLVYGLSRTTGAVLGLALLATRQLLRRTGPPVGGGVPRVISETIGILQGIPVIRKAARRVLGPTLDDVLVSMTDVATLTLSGNPLGLIWNGVTGLRLLTAALPRRAAWQRYEAQIQVAPPCEPGKILQLEAGDRSPLPARVVEGTGTVTGLDGLPVLLAPGAAVPPGARLSGGPFALELEDFPGFTPEERTTPYNPTHYDRYLLASQVLSFAFAGLTAIRTRSLAQAFAAMVLVNPRTALAGATAADLGATARVLRAGVTVVNPQRGWEIHRPHLLLIDSPRALTAGLELTSTLPLTDTRDVGGILALGGAVALAAGSPWSGVFPAAPSVEATQGQFDGQQASATIAGTGYTLGPASDADGLPAVERLIARGDYPLVLRRADDGRALGLFALRPRLAPGIADLIQTCQQCQVELAVLTAGAPAAAEAISRRTGIRLLPEQDAKAVIRQRQQQREAVTLVSDRASAAEALRTADLAIALTTGSTAFPARVDLIAPNLTAVAAIIDASRRRDDAARDSVALSVVANGLGIAQSWGALQPLPGVSNPSYITSLAAIADGWLRLRGGERPRSALAHVHDPRPERWGRRSVDEVLRLLGTSLAGLSGPEAVKRQRQSAFAVRHHPLLMAVLEQVRSPLIGIMAVGGALSLALGSTVDVIIIGATIITNVAVGAWQQHRATQAAEALEQMSAPTARVLRDGEPRAIPASDVVVGDLLLLNAGDRVAADARVVESQGLEVDEAALTGESLPVRKLADEGPPASRVVLEGSDVTTGRGQAIAVAVGRGTRLGSIAAALTTEETGESPLDARLSSILHQVLPISIASGAIVTTLGLLRGQSPLAQVALGASMTIAAVPEGLPLLSRLGQAAVARRLATHDTIVRRLGVVEALGRVDVACADKTGTLTQGTLALHTVASPDESVTLPGPLLEPLRHLLLTAALASPPPDVPGVAAHPTDLAVIRGAEAAGLDGELHADRGDEVPFDPTRAFHASRVAGRLCLKGAPETLLARCDWVRSDGGNRPLGPEDRQRLLDQSARLANEGLRVLMVAEGTPDTPANDPQGLVALGFLGIRDPIRPGVRAAVRRCHEAGVHVIMLTGDHPNTAQAIAREAGLLTSDEQLLNAADIAELGDEELAARLARTTVIARATPLDKVRIVESLQRAGHAVAMTGDGVNDAPSLRLADAGIAMGQAGTEVARQAADVVIADDDFRTLVEALVEGRSFWHNIRRAVGLLLGGNLGEIALLLGASIFSRGVPLAARQILAVNMISDVLPALAIALQRPRHRNLAGLAREGEAALERPLFFDIGRRALATGVPSLVAYILARRASLGAGQSVAFGSIIATQLAQTLDMGGGQDGISRWVLGAVGGSTAVLVAALGFPPLRTFLGLGATGPAGWLLIVAAAVAAVLLSRLLGAGESRLTAMPAA